MTVPVMRMTLKMQVAAFATETAVAAMFSSRAENSICG